MNAKLTTLAKDVDQAVFFVVLVLRQAQDDAEHRRGVVVFALIVACP